MFEDAEDIAGFFDSDDGFAVIAIYREGGTGDGVPLAVIPSRPDETVSIFDRKTSSRRNRFLIPKANVPNLKAGDTLEINGEILTVQGVPSLDQTGSLFSVEGH
ncbi:hypothetical protein [Thalassospira sp. TSL5-1]|uniref:head-tail joining protein n=1 Tax=Thalassospira sp. TSL5-1 TaxID=1544451 RepID=UPI000962C8C8|nr:hypothetical protein [Thalassospira sp. TSL5-1]OKH89216.1 hypothetical protein LF95_04070 [Thalassospira sp. TSL5-1]